MVNRSGGNEQGNLANASGILSLIASGTANSRAALLAASGMSRVTVTQRLNVLLGIGLVEETLRTLPSGGRHACPWHQGISRFYACCGHW